MLSIGRIEIACTAFSNSASVTFKGSIVAATPDCISSLIALKLSISSWKTLSGILDAPLIISLKNKLLNFKEKVCFDSGSSDVCAISGRTSDGAKLIPSDCMFDMASRISFFDEPVKPPFSFNSLANFAPAEAGESFAVTVSMNVKEPVNIVYIVFSKFVSSSSTPVWYFVDPAPSIINLSKLSLIIVAELVASLAPINFAGLNENLTNRGNLSFLTWKNISLVLSASILIIWSSGEVIFLTLSSFVK